MKSVSPELPHVVIIGAGFGGLQAALHLANAQCRVTVIDRNNHHLFQPLLYQVATAGLSPGEIAVPIRHVLRNAKNIQVLMSEVIGVDKNEKTVLLEQGRSIPYDYLIIATGSRHSYFGHDDWEPFAPGLKSISDATKIRAHILCAYEQAELETDLKKQEALLTVVIVGGGPTGVEMAGSIAELARKVLKNEFHNIDPSKTRVILAEAGPRVLGGFPESLSSSAQKELEKLGVEVHVNTRIENIQQNGVRMNGENVEAHTIIWAAGVQASHAAEWLGIFSERDGKVPISPQMNIEGHSEIFVIGDTAKAIGADGKPLPGLAPVAMQQGRYVAKKLRALISRKAYSEPFHYTDKGMLATIGRTFSVASIWKLKVTGWIAWLIWVFVHIMYLIGFRNRVIVMLDWIWAYVSYQRAVRLIVEDKPTR